MKDWNDNFIYLGNNAKEIIAYTPKLGLIGVGLQRILISQRQVHPNQETVKKLCVLFFIIMCYSSFSQTRKFTLVCKETSEENEYDKQTPIITKTCFLDKYKFVAIGTPDYKGRYFWEYHVYKKVKTKFIKANNSDIFQNIDELENIINSEIEKEYNSNKKNPELKDCLDFIKLKHFSINQMGINFDESKNMVFNTSFEIPLACLNVDGNEIAIDLNRIKKYLKQ